MDRRGPNRREVLAASATGVIVALAAPAQARPGGAPQGAPGDDALARVAALYAGEFGGGIGGRRHGDL